MPYGSGGGSTIVRIELSPAAAEQLRQRIGKPRYTKADANAAVSVLLDPRTTVPLPAQIIAPAVPWIEQAIAQCFNPVAKQALETLLAAIRAADEQ